MRMIDGFNEGWIDFEGGDAEHRTGRIPLEFVLGELADKADAPLYTGYRWRRVVRLSCYAKASIHWPWRRRNCRMEPPIFRPEMRCTKTLPALE